jgi:cytochrome c oxidase subunit I
MAETIGAFTIALSVLVFMYNAVHSMRHGRLAGNDPWDGRTLEWSIPSPPPHYNFVEIPTVTAMDDWWHKKYGAAGHEAAHAAPVHPPAMAGAAENHVEHDGERAVHVHMPDPSYFPIMLAAGMFIMAVGMVTNFWVCLPGFFVLLAGLYGWSFEPVNAPTPPGSAELHAAPIAPRTPVATH